MKSVRQTNVDDHLDSSKNSVLCKVYDHWIITFEEKVFTEKNKKYLALKYSYMNNDIGKIYFRKKNQDRQFWLQDVDFSSELNELALIQPHADYSDLLNLYVRQITSQKYNPELFRKHAFNYIEGPLCDFLDFECENGIIIADRMVNNRNLSEILYKTELLPILESEGITCTIWPHKYLWLRDFVLPMGNGFHQINEEITLSVAGEEAAIQISRAIPGHHITRDWPDGIEAGIGGGGCSPSKFSIMMRKSIIDLCMNNQTPFLIPNVLLEGGNIITVIKDNKLHVIIGKNLLYINAAYLKNKSRYSQFQQINPNDKYFDLHGLAKKYNICESDLIKAQTAIEIELNLPPERIIWLDNYDFHLDLYLSAGPNGVIFIHDHQLISRIVENDFINTNDPRSFNARICAIELNRIAGDILENNIKELEKRNFRVVKVPGMAYRINRDREYIMFANFMNGFSGKGKYGYFHIALSSSIEALNQAFRNILAENGVDHVYLIGNAKEVENILREEGSLRCMSCAGSNIFGHLLSNLKEDRKIDEQESLHSDDSSSEYESLESSDDSSKENHVPVQNNLAVSRNIFGMFHNTVNVVQHTSELQKNKSEYKV